MLNRVFSDDFLQMLSYLPVFFMGIAAGALISQAVNG